MAKRSASKMLQNPRCSRRPRLLLLCSEVVAELRAIIKSVQQQQRAPLTPRPSAAPPLHLHQPEAEQEEAGEAEQEGPSAGEA